MLPDPKWLEILKASGWKTLAIAAACGVFLLLAGWHLIPALAAWMTQLAVIVALVCGFLTLASFVVAVNRFFPLQTWLTHWSRLHRERRALRGYIPCMTPDERKIIGYLLAHNQKMFTGASDGGYAVTLISRQIVRHALQPGQVFSEDDMPMGIPDHLWKVLEEHHAEFPISEEEKEGPYPWRVPWQLR